MIIWSWIVWWNDWSAGLPAPACRYEQSGDGMSIFPEGSATLITLSSGLQLPDPPRAAGAYRPAVVANGFIFLSGFGPRDDAGAPMSGIVGSNMTVEEGRQAARNVGLSILAVLYETLGSLDRVLQVVKLTGMVNATPDFTQHPRVIDGCSQVLVEALGSRGEHARAAYGAGSLPFGAPVSIECICQIEG
jgi:enamine deaminase RidA (YjgF/YER057c/UK114 family)